jgi:arylsulfatase/uncharacterized sulfatase
LNTYKFYAGEGGIRTPMIISGVPGAQPNQIQGGLTHVKDIMPTLLGLAQVALPGSSYKSQPIEAISGVNLLPLMRGETPTARQADEVLGYELSGNLALFKGNLKLTKNLPPVGDGQWHLYDLSTDPGETLDLQSKLPDAFKAMQSDYEAYAKHHGVLPMPEGYSPVRQVLINSVLHYWWPTYGVKALVSLAGLTGLVVLLVVRRRRRKA